MVAQNIGLLQRNLNHCARAQDLFLHTLAQCRCGIGIVAEPYRVRPSNPCWATNNTGSVAITWRREDGSPPCKKVGEGRACTVVEWGPLWVIGVYLPPSVDSAIFGDLLDEIAILVQGRLPDPIVVAGDFNAKAHESQGQSFGRLGSGPRPPSHQ